MAINSTLQSGFSFAAAFSPAAMAGDVERVPPRSVTGTPFSVTTRSIQNSTAIQMNATMNAALGPNVAISTQSIGFR